MAGSIATLMQQLRDAGAPMEAIMIAVAAVEAVEAKHAAAEEARKADQRERTARSRAKSRDSNVTVTSQQRDPAPKDNNQTPTQPNSPTDPDGSVAPAPKVRKARKRALPDNWQPGQLSDQVRAELGRDAGWMHRTAAAMRAWAKGKGEVRADWDSVHESWMRREVDRECERNTGQPRAGPAAKPSSHGSLSRAASLLEMNNGQPSDPSLFTDRGPVIDHEDDGRHDREVHEPSGGQAGRFSPQAALRLVGAGRH